MWLMSHLTPVGSLELAKLALTNLIGLFECGRQVGSPKPCLCFTRWTWWDKSKVFGECNIRRDWFGAFSESNTSAAKKYWFGCHSFLVSRTVASQPAVINFHQKSWISQSRHSLRPGFGPQVLLGWVEVENKFLQSIVASHHQSFPEHNWGSLTF